MWVGPYYMYNVCEIFAEKTFMEGRNFSPAKVSSYTVHVCVMGVVDVVCVVVCVVVVCGGGVWWV